MVNEKEKVFVGVREVICSQLDLDENSVRLNSHLSNHLGADQENDLTPLLIALEEKFNIEISDEESGNSLGISWVGDEFSLSSCSSSSYQSSFRTNASEKCVVENFVELIYQKMKLFTVYHREASCGNQQFTYRFKEKLRKKHPDRSPLIYYVEV